ncbi:MAG TPA: DUF3108 domain-containing protein [Thermoanaerobaculia bacterium]|nr:DUF3108 domain-containing protein [Thermoanaerobaculia bacterium]
MTKIQRLIAALSLTLVSVSAFAAGTEELRYSWRLRGGVRFLAGLMFPTSGVGNLKTTTPANGGHTVQSELLITAPNGKKGGYYAYETELDERGAKTLMTFHGYAWGKKSRDERTVFDYTKRLARIEKKTPEETENKVKKLPAGGDQMRDVLTAIYFMRQNAHSLTAPMQTSIYSDGKEYPVILKPGETKNFVIGGKQTRATAYEIVDAPGGKKWPGGVKVWLSADARRLPVRIEIQQSVAALQLDLQSFTGPAVASK